MSKPHKRWLDEDYLRELHVTPDVAYPMTIRQGGQFKPPTLRAKDPTPETCDPNRQKLVAPMMINSDGSLAPRTEAFCQILARPGVDPGTAYARAGYSVTQADFRAAAERLAVRPEVAARVALLRTEYEQNEMRGMDEVDDLIRRADEGMTARELSPDFLLRHWLINLRNARMKGDLRAANEAMKFLMALAGYSYGSLKWQKKALGEDTSEEHAENVETFDQVLDDTDENARAAPFTVEEIAALLHKRN